MNKIKSVPRPNPTASDGGAKKTELDAEGPIISENLVVHVFTIDVQLRHHGLVGAQIVVIDSVLQITTSY